MKLTAIIKLITDMCSRKFHGKLTISFDCGKIAVVKPEQSIREGQEYLFVKQER